ncbi:MAG: RHS repeat-associated core domain-containing protein, partial [Verrucomicrobiae bacterium]|nr:RHS repeat-associated core domain-containing protein [Verrucomicrobiae bacterium]
ASSSADRRFVWGIRSVDDLILRDDTSQRLYALSDALGSVTAVVNTSGTVQERYGYDGFGTPRYMTAAFGYRDSSSYGWETLFDGYRYDTIPGLYQVRYRFLHPSLGRWLNRDPIGERGGVNLYAFVANEPLSQIDPLGLSSKIYGDGQLCVDKKCKANMLTDLRYLSEADPTQLLPLPAPGKCVDADAFYAPGWAWKIPDNATLRIKCDDDGCISNITNNKLGIFGKRPIWEWDNDNNKPGPKPPKWPGDIPPYPNTPPKEEPPKN